MRSWRRWRKQANEFLARPRVVRVTVLLRVSCVVAVLLFLVWQIHIYGYGPRVRDVPLSLAYSFLTMQVLLVTVLLLLSSLLKSRSARAGAGSAEVVPVVRHHLTEYLHGDDRRRVLLRLCLWHGADVQRCILQFLSAVQGSARERLTGLAVLLQLPWVWEKVALYGTVEQRREAAHSLGLLALPRSRVALRKLLFDASPHVQTAACRALIALGRPEDIERVLLFSLEAPLMVRAILVSELAPHARALSESVFHHISHTGPADRVVAALELAAGWMLPVPLPLLSRLLASPQPAVRAAALAVLPYHGASPATELWILAGLADPDILVRTQAIRAASRLQLPSAIPALVALLAGDQPEALARESCRGLAALGRDGWQVLEDTIRTRGRAVASQAAEALSGALVGAG